MGVTSSGTWSNSGATYSENKGEVIAFGNGDGTVTAKYKGLSVSASITSNGIPPLHGPATWEDAYLKVCPEYNGVSRVFKGNASETGKTHGGQIVHEHEHKKLWSYSWYQDSQKGVTLYEQDGKWVEGPPTDINAKLYFHCYGEDTEIR